MESSCVLRFIEEYLQGVPENQCLDGLGSLLLYCVVHGNLTEDQRYIILRSIDEHGDITTDDLKHMIVEKNPRVLFENN